MKKLSDFGGLSEQRLFLSSLNNPNSKQGRKKSQGSIDVDKDHSNDNIKKYSTMRGDDSPECRTQLQETQTKYRFMEKNGTVKSLELKN